MVPDDVSHRLLVEGVDDEHSVIHLIHHHHSDFFKSPDPRAPYIEDCGGYSPLLGKISTAAKTYSRLGVVIDANSDPAGRWRSLCDRFAQAGITLSTDPVPTGTVIRDSASNSCIGVWMMPDNSEPGYLEHFLEGMVAPENSLWQYAVGATTESRKHEAAFADKDEQKARVHAYLAWQEEPGKPFGTAITMKYFNAESDPAKAFVNWFKRLFIDQSD